MHDKEESQDKDYNQDNEKIDMVGAGLMRLAEEQIGIRQVVEDRWLASLEQYIGNYDVNTSSRLKKSGGSQAFVNGTRSKTAAAESRLSEMLFPSDDKNWGIDPTPVPDLKGMMKSKEDLIDDEGVQIVDDKTGKPMSYADHATIILQEAADKAALMEDEINDQLVEANYQDVCRSVIHDACLFGSGVIKAPVVMNRTRKSWDQVKEDVHELRVTTEHRPGVEHVKIWDFFPDMSAITLDDCGFFFERRFVSKKQLIELAQRPGYLEDQIRSVIKENPTEQTASGSSYIAKLRELSDLSVDINKGKYELWEYHGPLDKDNIRSCGCDVDEDDEFAEKNVVAVFVGSRIIKVDMNPMETGDMPYSMFIYEKDDSSLFGMGVPHLIRHEQRIVNSVWRMLLDNAGLSTGPQIIQNREVITPSDGTWDLKPRKQWFVNNPETNVNQAFATFDIPSHQVELTAIYELAKQMMDDVTNLPLLAQGEVGGAPDTASGMSMLLNSSNVVLRRIVKQFDDGITSPVISRFYDWNMQNSENEGIKGDYKIHAKGSSTLLVKESQTQALLGLLQIANAPQFAEITKLPELYRKAVQAQHLMADDIVKTDDEIEAEKDDSNQIPPEVAIAQAEMQLKLQIEQMKNETDITIAQIRSQDSSNKTEMDERKTQLQEDNKANLFMAEAQLKEREGSGI